MKLIQVNELIPERNENHELVKWNQETVLINPANFQAARYIKEIDKVTISLTNGKTIVVDATLRELDRLFEQATLMEEY